MGDNLMRSIMIPHGYYVRLMKDDRNDYQDNDYITIEGSEYSDDGRMECVNLSEYDYDSKVSSFIIYAETSG